MHSSGSFLTTILERIRFYLDEVDVDAKYPDDFLIREVVCPSMTTVLSRLNNTQQSPVVNKFSITAVTGTTRYLMPPSIQHVLRVVSRDSNGHILFDSYPRGRFSIDGPGWSLEGTPGGMELEITTPLDGINTLEVWYISNFDFLPYMGSGTLSSDKLSIILGTATAGGIDRRPGAYIGTVARLLPSAPTPIEERLISGHSFSGGTWTITVNKAFVYGTSGAVTLEVAPAFTEALFDAIALWSCLALGAARKLKKSQTDDLTKLYRAAMKTIGDNLTTLQVRTGTHFERDTIDNPLLGVGFFPPRPL